MLVRKTLLAPGSYQAAQGTVDASPERLRSFVDNFNALKAKGHSFGVPFSHLLNPETGESLADPTNREFLASRFNGGFIEKLEIGQTGTLDGVLDIPACSGMDPEGRLLIDTDLGDGRKVKTAIKEVSVGIWPEVTLNGETYRDIIGHVALTPTPQWGGQPGFQALSAINPKAIYLAASMRNNDDDSPDSDELADRLQDAADGGKDASEGDGMDEIFDDSPLTPEVDPMAETVGQICSLFQAAGVPLPEGTTPENVLERILVAMTAIKGRIDKAASQPEPEPDNTPITEDPSPSPTMMAAVRENPVMLNLANREIKRRNDQRAKELAAFKRLGVPQAAVDLLASRPITLAAIVGPDHFQDKIDFGHRVLKAALKDSKFRALYMAPMTPTDALPANGHPGEVEQPKWRPDIKMPMTDSDYEAVQKRVAAVSAK